MSSLFPAVFLLLLLLPILIAIRFSSWHIIIAFVLTITVLPFIMLCLVEFYQLIIGNEGIGFNHIFEISSLLSIAGTPIYFIFTLPAYHFLKKQTFPLVISFPLLNSLIILTIAHIIAEREIELMVILVFILCSVTHALCIIFLASKLKKKIPKTITHNA